MVWGGFKSVGGGEGEGGGGRGVNRKDPKTVLLVIITTTPAPVVDNIKSSDGSQAHEERADQTNSPQNYS